MAGPFSWPKIIDRLNQHFVPLRVAPDAAAAARFGLEPYRFVEPGFIVLAPDPAGRGVEGQGAEGRFELLRRVDQVTTLHPDWLLHLIRQCGAGPAVAVEAAGLESIWTLPEASAALVAFRRFMSDPWRREIDLSVFAGSAEEPGHRLETMLMMGMIQYYLGDHAAARETWGKVIEADPEHPLAWKAAAEREGFGPFVRGFEVHGPLPRSVWQAGIASEGSAAPAGAYSETELWERSTKFLLAMQRGDGALMDSDYDFGGTDSLPNVYVAVTALAGLSLMEAENRLPALAAEIRGAIERAADFVRDEGNLNPTDRDEILWAYAYRLRFLVARYRLGQESLATVNAAIQRLESVQGRRGSWYHEYSNSFVTATALVALADAHQAGGTVNQDIVDRGVQSLKRDRYANGAFPYSNGRNAGDNAGVEGDLVASAGRMPICELALLLWGHSDQDRLRFAVQTSLQHHDKLALGYKYDNHTSTLAYGGFFFWYDMRSRAEAIRHLQSGDEVDGIQAQAADQHRRLIAQLPELDGCFVDSHELGRCYGSAMALLSMSTLDLVEPVRDAK
jgi:hypothetical protein